MKKANLRDVAKAAKVSVATVSLALRNHPSISESTRKKILKVANQLGYQPNPRVAELMNHIRHGRHLDGLTECLALYWADVGHDEVKQTSYLSDFESEARKSLSDKGFGLECFYQNPEVSPERLQQILKARGIRGIILAPLMHTPRMQLDWDWHYFSIMITGSALWQPDFNRVQFHHFSEMVTMLHHLQEAGKSRIGLVVDSDLDNRSQHAITGGFWAGLQNNIPKREAFFDPRIESQQGLSRWLRSYKPDCVIIGYPPALKWMEEANSGIPIALRTKFYNGRGNAYPGIHQDFGRLGCVAAEQLIGQLMRNEVGIPTHPLQTFITGDWLEK